MVDINDKIKHKITHLLPVFEGFAFQKNLSTFDGL